MEALTRSIGVVLITHNARRHLPYCLPRILRSNVKPRVLVVNSSSADGTVEMSREMGADTLVIPRNEFNHGATRELARHHIGTDIVVMMTPDAYPESDDFLERLVRPLLDGQASLSYARQIPHENADFFEAFPRRFNYPNRSELRDRNDMARLGAYVFFCSDSCAAWVNAALDEVGGFPTVLTNEDQLAAAKLIARGHRIAYVADAVVRHSHRYSLLAEFRRYFDNAYARGAGKDGLLGQSDEVHGRKFVVSFFAHLVRERPWALPYGICQIGAKYLGYRLGRAGVRLPLAMARCISLQNYYWTSVHFRPPDAVLGARRRERQTAEADSSD